MEPWYRFVAPHFWGVGSFKIQESSLGNQVFDIQEGEFLFPDNTHVVLGENGVLHARSFESAWEDGGKSFRVYLGLKKWSDNGENVTSITDVNELSQVSNRFVSSTAPEEIVDFHGNGPKAEIRRMQFLVQIFWESEIDNLGDFVLIPIAKLRKNLEDIVVADDFIPPSLAIGSSRILEAIVREVKDQLFSKTRQLESVKRSKGVHTAEFGSRDMVYMLALRSLNRYVPLLTHLTTTTQGGPWSIYGILRQIVGELSSFCADISAGGELADGTSLLPEYDHKELYKCFSGAQSLITRMLNEITAGPEYILPLHFDGTYFTAEMAPGIFDEGNRFYLVMETEQEPASLIEAIRHIAKLSARESLPILIAQSLPGVKLNHLDMPPQELPRKAGAVYFQIDQHAKQWDQVMDGGNIALYWDTAPDDLNIELMVVRRN